MHNPRHLTDCWRWRHLVAERGLEIAALTVADEVILAAPFRATMREVQASIDGVLRALTKGSVTVRLVPDNYPTCYRIDGALYALEAA